ncbi:MAG TPA: sugar ABC transporter permease [Polyangia bacterium]|nr:sugar ABC transporter permease [Polyangia bacterium]
MLGRLGRLFNRDAFRDSTLLLVVAGIWIFFQFTTEGTFLTQRNLVLLALQTSIVSLAAISAVMLIVTRNFDLSVGSAVALVGVVVAVLTVNHDMNPLLALPIALLAGVAMGAWQGLWVTRMGVSSFIVTLAGMLYFRGASMIATNGATIAPLPDALADLATGFLAPGPSIALIVVGIGALAGFQLLGARRAQQLGLMDAVGAHLVRRLAPFVVGGLAFGWVATRQGIPYLVLLVAAAAVGAEVVMRRTRFGLQLYAIGGNPEAARLSGIRVNRVIFANFLIAGLAYGVTGVALTARVGGAVAGSAGLFLELDAISAAIIGGTSLTGGRGRVFGALVGALLMGSLNNGMSLMNVPTFYQETARGVVLLFAVAADQYRRTRKSTGRKTT